MRGDGVSHKDPNCGLKESSCRGQRRWEGSRGGDPGYGSPRYGTEEPRGHVGLSVVRRGWRRDLFSLRGKDLNTFTYGCERTYKCGWGGDGLSKAGEVQGDPGNRRRGEL